MQPTTPGPLTRLARLLALAVAVATLATPAVALGAPGHPALAPDWFERYAAVHPYGQGILQTNVGSDVFERYVAAHRTGVLAN